VNAPAVLLWLSLLEKQEIIRAIAGHHELARQDKTLYPYFFPAEEEARITDRLLRAEPK